MQCPNRFNASTNSLQPVFFTVDNIMSQEFDKSFELNRTLEIQ